MQKIERYLNFLAALVTLFNLYFAIPNIVDGVNIPFQIDFHFLRLNLATRLVALFILELSLASAFGYVFKSLSNVLIRNRSFLPSYIIFICIVSLISAWISVFNLEFVLIQNSISGFWAFFGFFFLVLLVYAIASLFIFVHIDNLIQYLKKIPNKLRNEQRDLVKMLSRLDSDDEVMVPIIIQGLAFLVIFIAMIIDS